MKCIAHYRMDHVSTERCYSPTACSAFGYCRERNFDGRGMSEVDIARRKFEQEALEVKPSL